MSKRRLYEEGLGQIARLLAAWPPERVDAVIEDALGTWMALHLKRQFRWRWNARLRTTLGRAVFDDWTVELNPLLLARHPEEMEGLIVHELAHLVIVRRHGWTEPAHGDRWKALMRAAGQSTAATHDLPVEDLRVRSTARRRPRRRIAGRRWMRR